MSSDESLELLPEDFLAGRAIPQDMIIALRVIAQLDSETVRRIAEYLSSLHGVTGENEVRDGINAILREPGDDDAASILQTLINVRPGNVSKSIGLLDRWRQSSDDRRTFFDDDLFANRNCLPGPWNRYEPAVGC
jgi:hypothetical protein